MQEAWKNHAPSTNLKNMVAEKQVLVSASPSTREELSEYLTEVTEKLSNDWKLKKRKLLSLLENHRERSYCLYAPF